MKKGAKTYNQIAIEEVEETLINLIDRKKANFVVKHRRFPENIYLNINIFRVLKLYLNKQGITLHEFENTIHLSIKTTKEKTIKLT